MDLENNISTKQRILDAALDLFSKKGFTAVSVRDISGAVGIKESSLYNHFKNKQDIFDTILYEYTRNCDDFFLQQNIIGDNMKYDISNNQVNFFSNMSDEQFVDLSMNIFNQFYLNPQVVKFWRILAIEQYNNPEIAKLYNKLLFEDVLNYQSQVLGLLISKGILIETDPYILALQFYAPMYLLFQKYFASGHEKIEVVKTEAQKIFKNHILHFRKVNSNKRSGE
jgi:AcrR family transcriptional regulator